MKTLIKTTVASLAIALLSGNAFADTQQFHPGVYIDAGAGAATAIAGDDSGIGGPAGTVQVGYRFTPNWAIEAGVTGLGEIFALSSMYHLAVRGALNLGDRFELFAKLGGAHMDTTLDLPFLDQSVSASTNGIFGGFGVYKGFGQNSGISLQFQGMNNIENGTMSTGLLGATTIDYSYRF